MTPEPEYAVFWHSAVATSPTEFMVIGGSPAVNVNCVNCVATVLEDKPADLCLFTEFAE